MSSALLPHQQYISGTSATDGAQAFAGIVHGNVYYGNTGAREREYIRLLDPVFESVVLTSRPASTTRVPLKPFSTVPFRRDPDFVDRGDTLAQID
jgi:hypothetical protein